MSTGGNTALKFVVEVQNKQAIAELTEDIKQQEHEIKVLTAALKAGAISETQFKTQAMAAGQAIANANKEIHALDGATGTAGRGLSQLSYALDDIQYGFSSIVNNIPQIVMGLGGGVGLAGAIGIAAVAVNQLIKHWGDLSDMAQSAWAGGSIDQLHKIREAAEEAAAAFDKLTKEHTKAVEASGKFVHESIVEGPVGKILEGLALGVASEPGMKAEETLRDQMNRAMAPNVIEKQLLEGQLTKRLDEENRKKAAEMLVAINKPGEEGRIARITARRWARAAPESFPPGFAEQMEPEAAKRGTDFDKAADARKQVEAKIKAADAEHLSRMEKEGAVDKAAEAHKRSLERQNLEDEKKATIEAIRRGEHMLTPEGRRQLQNQMLGGVAPESSQIMSTKAFADKMLTSGMNTVPQKQLDELKGMHDNLKSIDKKILEVGRLG